jgi:hypothetical protein
MHPKPNAQNYKKNFLIFLIFHGTVAIVLSTFTEMQEFEYAQNIIRSIILMKFNVDAEKC